MRIPQNCHSASPLEGYWKQNNPSFEWMWTFILLKLRSIAQSKTRGEEMENCEKKQARGSKGRKHKLCISVKMTLLCLACSWVFKCQKSHRRQLSLLAVFTTIYKWCSCQAIKNFVYTDATLSGCQKCKEYCSQKTRVSQFWGCICKSPQKAQIR